MGIVYGVVAFVGLLFGVLCLVGLQNEGEPQS